MGVLIVLGLPFLGTTLGSACVFFMRRSLHEGIQRVLMGFAGGVMVAAAVWSLLIPAISMCGKYGRFSFLPALAGFFFGVFFLLLIDSMIPHLHIKSNRPEGLKSALGKTAMLILAVTIHNFPEGAACGAILAGALDIDSPVTMAEAVLLAVGIAVQNLPEGAIISMPLRAGGRGKGYSFLLGSLSGIVEPIGAAITVVMAKVMTPLLPYLLAFAAGAMLYVVVEELIPEANEGTDNNKGTIGFSTGFALMMVLDVMLG